jgi:hypothetical protein
MKTIVFFLEEPSARAMLEGVLPRLLPEHIQIRYHVFQGKQHLEKNITSKLRGWLAPDSVFVVMRDQDRSDCMQVKAKLADLCHSSGKTGILIRVACRTLESFYIGDLAAVENGLNLSGIKSQQNRSRFRNPDSLMNPKEDLLRLTRNIYTEVAGSRSISPHLNLETNLSKSFIALVSGIKKILSI